MRKVLQLLIAVMLAFAANAQADPVTVRFEGAVSSFISPVLSPYFREGDFAWIEFTWTGDAPASQPNSSSTFYQGTFTALGMLGDLYFETRAPAGYIQRTLDTSRIFFEAHSGGPNGYLRGDPAGIYLPWALQAGIEFDPATFDPTRLTSDPLTAQTGSFSVYYITEEVLHSGSPGSGTRANAMVARVPEAWTFSLVILGVATLCFWRPSVLPS